MKFIVPCAGMGKRLGTDHPKILSPIGNKIMLDYIIEPWNGIADEFVFIVGYRKEEVIKHLPKNSRWIEQREQRGLAHAILQVESIVDKKFVVILGDCIFQGLFKDIEAFELGIGVWDTPKIQEFLKSYLVEVDEKKVSKVTEKPSIEKVMGLNKYEKLCGLGVYFFDQRVFDYTRKTPISRRSGEIEITDVIQNMINGGEEIAPVYFEGNYINITYQN